MTLPLEGVRIAEMGQLIAIPHAAKLLADMGAQVVRIESSDRLDMYRTITLYRNNADGEYWNRGGNLYEQNRNKLGLTLDLNKPEGLALLKELISVSDVFLENFTPRVMKKFGLEYDDLRRIRPDIIMVSSTGYGHTGPWANLGAIGFATEAASGLAHMTGYKDGPPLLPEVPYADYTAAEHTAFAIMAALIHRAQTGEGQFIDVSQSETLTVTIPEALMDYTVNGRIEERAGNQDPDMAPHGFYPCRGADAWIAIAVASDDQWRALCEVLGKAAWLEDRRFDHRSSRLEHVDELDTMLGDATGAWDHRELMAALQARRVPAGAALNSKELLFDPHLGARGFYETAAHHPDTGMPPLPYTGRPWTMSETPGGTRRAAPTMGEHNRLVLGDILGQSDSALQALEVEGVIGCEPARHRPPRVEPMEEQKRKGLIVDFDRDFECRVREEYGFQDSS